MSNITEVDSGPRGRALLGGRTFRSYSTAYLLFVFGNSVANTTIPLIVLGETGSASLTGLAATLGYFPFLVFGLVAGGLADQLDKRWLMTGAAALGTAAAIVPVILVLGGSGLVAVVILVRFVVGIAEVWHTMTHFATLPYLIERHQLVSASALLQAATVAIGMVAPLGAVLVLDSAGYRPVFLAVTVLFALAGALRLLVRADTGPTTARAGEVARGLLPGIREGFRVTFQNPMIRVITTTGFLGSVGFGTVSALIAVYLFSEFQVAASDPLQGVFLAGGAVGALLLTWFLPAVRRRWSPVASIVLTQALVAASMLALALSVSLEMAFIAFALFSGWGSMMFTNIISMRMEALPREQQGKVGSASRLIGSGGVPVGGIIGGLLLSVIDIRTLFLASLGVWAVSFAVAWLHRGVRSSGLV